MATGTPEVDQVSLAQSQHLEPLPALVLSGHNTPFLTFCQFQIETLCPVAEKLICDASLTAAWVIPQGALELKWPLRVVLQWPEIAWPLYFCRH